MARSNDENVNCFFGHNSPLRPPAAQARSIVDWEWQARWRGALSRKAFSMDVGLDWKPIQTLIQLSLPRCARGFAPGLRIDRSRTDIAVRDIDEMCIWFLGGLSVIQLLNQGRSN